MAVLYRRYMRKSKGSDEKKCYIRIMQRAVVDSDELAEMIQQRCSLTAADVKSALVALGEVFTEQLCEGQRVDLDGIGQFKIGLESFPADSMEEWNQRDHLRGYHVNFVPERVAIRDNGKRRLVAKVLKNLKLKDIDK